MNSLYKAGKFYHVYVLTYCSYKGHKNEDYKLDSLLSHTDAHVVSGSENGKIYFWDLVEVHYLLVKN